MLVRATAQGYYEGFREVGAEFEVPDTDYMAPWWVKATEVVEVHKPAEATTFSELSKQSVRVEEEMIARKSTRR